LQGPTEAVYVLHFSLLAGKENLNTAMWGNARISLDFSHIDLSSMIVKSNSFSNFHKLELNRHTGAHVHTQMHTLSELIAQVLWSE
jgi:hypothetical protein